MVVSNKGFYRLTLWVSLCALLVLSFLPFQYKQELYTKGSLHNPGHFIVFAGLTCIAWKSASSPGQRIGFSMALAAVALAIEVAQEQVMLTPMEWSDVLIDLAGILIASFAMTMSDRRRATT